MISKLSYRNGARLHAWRITLSCGCVVRIPRYSATHGPQVGDTLYCYHHEQDVNITQVEDVTAQSEGEQNA